MGSTGKKVALLVVWLVMLGGLIFWIKKSDPSQVHRNEIRPAPKMDAAGLAAQWPQIVAHAAAPPRGNPAARYTLAEFGDFQCPQCGKARPHLESLLKKYPALVNLIFVHRPFPQIHEWALPAGQVSEIAAAQGKFWPMYDVLYDRQGDLDPAHYGDYAAQAGLDKAQFEKAFRQGQGQDKVQAASAFADTLNVGETPTVLVHDNVTGKVTIYVGLTGTQNTDGSPQYPGVQALFAQPPWRT